jgi:hypothetical protein
MKIPVCLRGILFTVLFTVFFSFSNSVDINNEKAVMKDIQGTWVGCQNIGKVYRYFKLSVADNLFEGWMQTTDYPNEPIWEAVPDEKGIISLSSLINDPEKNFKYRKFSLTCPGRCCGDKSFSVVTLTKLITYLEGKGLMLEGKVEMIKK